LALYRAPEFLPERLTTLRLLTRPASALQAAAVRLQPIVQQAVGPEYEVVTTELSSQIGSGALPVDQIPSYGLAIRTAARKNGSANHSGVASMSGAARTSVSSITGAAGSKTAARGKHAASLDRLEARLRALPRPVIGRLADKTLWLDLRCLESADEAEFTAQWSALVP
jgi:L-seryl-tRNA(Ser) seleniumtransferase